MRKIYARISPLITSPPATNGLRRTRHRHPPAPCEIRRGAPLNAYHARGTWHGREEKKARAREISRHICRPSSRVSRRDGVASKGGDKAGANQRVICLGLPIWHGWLTAASYHAHGLPPSRDLRQGILYETDRCALGLSFKHTKSTSRVLLTIARAHARDSESVLWRGWLCIENLNSGQLYKCGLDFPILMIRQWYLVLNYRLFPRARFSLTVYFHEVYRCISKRCIAKLSMFQLMKFYVDVILIGTR